MHDKIRISGSLLIVIVFSMYLVSRNQTEATNSKEVATSQSSAPAASKIDTLRSMTEGALREGREKLAAIDVRIEETSKTLEALKNERSEASNAVKNMEKVYANLNDGSSNGDKAVEIRAVEKAKTVPAAPTIATNSVVTAAPAKSHEGAPKTWRDLVERVNRNAGKKVVVSESESAISLNGTGLILTDKPQPRIGSKAFENVSPILQRMRARRVGQVQVKVAPGTPEAQVNVLRKFLERNYGWKTNIQNVESSDANLAPIQVDITAE